PFRAAESSGLRDVLHRDKSMIKYYGHHDCKKFIRAKPIRFWYKVWSMYTEDGHLI
ncbi:hypothetical protein ILUMI_15960, partial [Ignelater luminosus]